MSWITANLGTIGVGLVLLLIVGAIVRSLLRGRKSGKSSCGGNCASCGCGCSHCSSAGASHPQ